MKETDDLEFAAFGLAHISGRGSKKLKPLQGGFLVIVTSVMGTSRGRILTTKTLLLCAFFLCFHAAVPARAEEYKWSSGGVNVRTGPGTNFEIMGQLYKNEKIEVFEGVNGWAKILFEDVEAYVAEDLLLAERIKTPEEEEAARIAADEERLRREEEERRQYIRHILKTILFALIGAAGFVIIVFKM